MYILTKTIFNSIVISLGLSLELWSTERKDNSTIYHLFSSGIVVREVDDLEVKALEIVFIGIHFIVTLSIK